MRRFAIGLVILALAGMPAMAQRGGGGGGGKPPDPEEMQKKRDAAELERQYKSTLERTRGGQPATPARTDPWANIRGTDTTKR